MSRRGFSLVEVLLVLVLLVILLAASLTVGKRSQSGSARGAAEAVASVLAAARQQAIARGTPVGVAFPSDGGSTPASTSLYLVEGWRNPRVTRTVNLANDFPDVFLFTGHWPLASGSYQAAEALPRPFNHEDFSVAAWGLDSGDRAIVFLPSGAAVSNGLAEGESYRIAALAGLEASPSSLAGVSSFVLTAAGGAATVSVSASGLVRVVDQLEGAAALPQAGAGTATPAPAGAAASSPVQSNPHSLDVQCYPVPAQELPPGVDATVKPDGYLTLEVSAVDDESDHLRCIWEADGGAFTATEEVEMRWDPEQALWRAVWCWRPEPEDSGRQYTLTCRVVDGRGGEVTGTIGAAGVVEVLGHGRLVFFSNRDGDDEIYTMNPDGSDLTQLTFDPANDQGPVWSPDGQKILFSSNRSGLTDLYLMERDGSNVRRLVDCAGNGFSGVVFADFAGTGSQVAFMADNGAGTDVYLVNLDGTDPRNPGTTGLWKLTNQNWPGGLWTLRGVTCHADGERLVVSGGYIAGTPAWGADLYEVRYYDRTTGTWLATPELTNLTNSPGVIESEPDLSLDGTKLAWYPGASWAVYNAPPGAAGSLGAVTPFPANGESPVWSPDGQRYTYQAPVAGNKECFVGYLDGSPSVQVTHSPSNDDTTRWSPF